MKDISYNPIIYKSSKIFVIFTVLVVTVMAFTGTLTNVFSWWGDNIDDGSHRSSHSIITISDTTIVGNHNTIHGDNNIIRGGHNRIHGENNTIYGNHNTINGANNEIHGNHNRFTPNVGNTAIGNHNREIVVDAQASAIELVAYTGDDNVLVSVWYNDWHNDVNSDSTVGRLGDTLNSGGMQWTFDGITRYVDDTEGSSLIDIPYEGNEFVILWFTITNTTDEDTHIAMSRARAYLDNFRINEHRIFWNMDGDQIWGNISAGRSTRGFVGYQVPSDWSVIEFRYNYSPFTGQGETLIFQATPNDIE